MLLAQGIATTLTIAAATKRNAEGLALQQSEILADTPNTLDAALFLENPFRLGHG